jgi:hypothetical protein
MNKFSLLFIGMVVLALSGCGKNPFISEPDKVLDLSINKVQFVINVNSPVDIYYSVGNTQYKDHCDFGNWQALKPFPGSGVPVKLTLLPKEPEADNVDLKLQIWANGNGLGYIEESFKKGNVSSISLEEITK